MAVQQHQKQNLQRPASGCCGFCKRNKEPESVYTSHQLKDAAGQVTCPQLFKYRCELCGSTGKEAHTRSYCPQVSNLRSQFGPRVSTSGHRDQMARTNFSANQQASEESQLARADNQAIRLASGRQFRNMSRVTNSKYNSAGRLRHPANNK